MGRPPKKVDPSAGPAAQFAIELRALREQAGNLPYWKMARRSRGSASKSALAQAAAGKQIPSERVLDAFVSVCGDDLNWWRARRQQALSELEAVSQPGTQLVPLTHQAPALPPGPSDETPGSQPGGAHPAPTRREDLLPTAGMGALSSMRSAVTGNAEDDIIDADIVEHSILRRVLAVAGRRTPLYLAGIAVLVAGTAVITATVQNSASTTTADRPHNSASAQTPMGVGAGVPTPPASGSASPPTSQQPPSSPTYGAPILPPIVAPSAPGRAPVQLPGSAPRHSGGGTANLPKHGSTATVYRVTGADSKGLAIQSQPHINHVIRYVPNGTTLHVACQTNHGDWVDNRWQYGRHFTTWNQLADGTWVYDWYTDTPRVDASGYSPGISPCPGG